MDSDNNYFRGLVGEELNRLAAAIEHAAEAIFVTDINGLIQYVNPAFERMTGFSRADALGRNPKFLRSGSHDAAFYNDMWGKITSGETWEGEFVNKKKSGAIYYVLASISPVRDENGNVINYVSVQQDITQIKKAQEELLQAKESAEAATKLKDKFVSIVVHDLKSPFTSILGLMRHMYKDKNHPLDEHQQDMVSRIIETCEGMSQMIDNLLDLSRLQTGNIVPVQKFFDGHMAVKKTIGQLSNLAEDKNVEIDNLVPPGCRLYADPDLYEDVLRNIVANAIKFSQRGGRISIYRAENSPTTLAVQDYGAGIPPDIVDHLFLHEIKTTTPGTEGEKGTGLGLPYSYEIMKANNGSLRVESELGKGSVFYIELPEMTPKALIVDDEHIARQVFKEELKKTGAEILEAKNGIEGLKLMDQERPHLVLLDIYMPDISGLEFLERAKLNPCTKSIPVIVITADIKPETRDKALRLGADDFITKPVIKYDLLPRARRFIV